MSVLSKFDLVDGAIAVDLRDKGSIVFLDEPLHPVQCLKDDLRNPRSGQVFGNHDEQPNQGVSGGGDFETPVANASVTSQDVPTPPPNDGEPVLVQGIRREVVVVDLDMNSGGAERIGNRMFANRAIKEEDQIFGSLLSYATASSHRIASSTWAVSHS